MLFPKVKVNTLILTSLKKTAMYQCESRETSGRRRSLQCTWRWEEVIMRNLKKNFCQVNKKATFAKLFRGHWRSWLARYTGSVEVTGSNPVCSTEFAAAGASF